MLPMTFNALFVWRIFVAAGALRINFGVDGDSLWLVRLVLNTLTAALNSLA